MSNLVVATFVTLDGVMEDPGGGEGFQHGGKQLAFFDPRRGHQRTRRAVRGRRVPALPAD